MEFSKHDLRAMTLGDSENLIERERWIVGQRRWVTEFMCVFVYAGKNYLTHFDMPSTECQENEAFIYGDNKIECPEVMQKAVLTTTWVEIEQEQEKENALTRPDAESRPAV
jgi:hypothetical protein